MKPAQAWQDILPRMRWFAGKGRSISSVVVHPSAWVVGPGTWPAVRQELLEVTYADGLSEVYQSLSAYRPDSMVAPTTLAVVELDGWGELALCDAATDMEAFAGYLAGQEFAEQVGELQPLLLTAETSNTNVRISPTAIYKLFRKPEVGPNREAELLTRLQDSGVTPRLFAQLWSPDHRLSAIVMEFVASVGDGWHLATDSLRSGSDFTAYARTLGQALAAVHDTLAGGADRPGEGAVSGSNIAANMLDRLDEAAAEVPAIAELADRIRPVFTALFDRTVPVQAVHGDFHLGQALYRTQPPGWVVIDFEGEPLKSVAERTRPDSPWRDVAGGLRSFEYARGVLADPDAAGARAWTRAARAAFLEGYSGGGSIPTELLRAYELDKAIYEVRYETRNRPDWVSIPLSSVQDDVTGISADSGPQP